MKDIFLVDADDTILDFHGASALALQKAFEENGITWSKEYLDKFRTFNASLWEALERKELTRDYLMDMRFPMFFAHLGMSEVDGKAFNQRFLHFLSTTPIYLNGAQEFLTKLGEIGRVFIVTKGTAWIQKSRFTLAKLYDYAENTFVSDLIGVNKPAKEYTDYVMAHINDFDKARAVWIGDSLSADIKAANDANITSIWFNPHEKVVSGGVVPDYMAKDFDEVLKIIQNFNDE